MGSITAIIHVGSSSTWHGGIHPSHTIYLYENSRPVFLMHNVSVLGNEENIFLNERKFFPSIENMLDDLYVFIASEIFNAFKIPEDGNSDIDVDYYRNHSKKCIAELDFKVVITTLQGSSLRTDDIDKFPGEYEIAKVEKFRNY